MSISAVILTKNSAKTLHNCLSSVDWCDEVFVIDDNSIDETQGLAEKSGAKVIEHNLSNDFAAQRNFGLDKATSKWVLFVDSDEIISKELAEEIKEKITTTDMNGFFIKRNDFMWGKELKHGEVGNMWLLRLGRKDKGKWMGKVHETWEIRSSTERLHNSLKHYPHPTMSKFLQKINFYSTLHAQELFEKKIKANWWDIILYPKAKFWINYIGKLGFFDGIPGFLVAIIMSFHSFLVRGKLWQLQNHNF